MSLNDIPTGHPAVRFERLPVVEGPLSRLEQERPSLIERVKDRTCGEFSERALEFSLSEALFQERLRLRREKFGFFTRARKKADRRLWGGIQAGLLKSGAEVERQLLLERIVGHYAEEIAGRFDPRVYRFATHVVPWGFNWLLNAASVRRFMPWKMTEALQSRLSVVGEVTSLQRLSQRGTILLVPTHQSNIDSILIGYLISLMRLPPFAYGAGLNLFSNPVLSFFMGNLGAYTVDRKKTNAIYKHTLKNYSTSILREGIHSIFFPGGGRSRSGAIESKLKLGLLGTALDAQLENHLAGKANPSVFIVPMTTSYHFVFEASSLIEDYLIEVGKSQFIREEDESWQLAKIAGFFWKLFSSQSGITVRIGRPLDIFGNFVDDEGRSMGPNGVTIDPVRWLTTEGALRAEAKRDQEYTRELGSRLSERFHRDNTVLTSHLVAFALFEALRKRYPELDLFRFLRLSLPQRSLPYADFLAAADQLHGRLLDLAGRGEVFLCPELRARDLRGWVEDGIRQLGILHEAAVAKLSDNVIFTEDMSLLYYYRNRLSGYGLSLLAGKRGEISLLSKPGNRDEKGFLA